MKPALLRITAVILVFTAVTLAAAEEPGHAGTVPSSPGTDPVVVVRTVADAVLRDHPEPPEFNWGEGVLMAGMMHSYRLTHDTRYLGFVRDWADHWREYGIGKILHREFQPGLTGYCGYWGPAFPLLLLYEETGDETYRESGRTVVEFVTTEATRTRDGGFDHWKDNGQLWVDTLYMTAPVLSTYARVTGEREYEKEAIRQLEVSTRHLQDPDTGLYYHMYNDRKRERVGCLWGRGNGWVVMSRVEVLKNMERGSAEWARLVGVHDLHLRGLLRVQDAETGMWHTVLDAPDTYLETSATAMILYALSESRRLGLTNPNLHGADDRAWEGLVRSMDGNSRVTGVSAGTGPTTKETYAAIERGTYPWGTGAFLLAACAFSEIGKGADREEKEGD